MKSGRWLTGMAAVLALAVCRVGYAGEEGKADAAPAAAAPAAGEVYKGVLPSRVIVQVRTGELNATVKNLEAFAMQAVQGTPAQMFVQPGFLAQEIHNIVELPPETIDMSKSGESLVIVPERDPNAPADAKADTEPYDVIVVEIPNFDQKINNARNTGFTVNEIEPGVLQVTSPMGGSNFLMKTGNGDAIVVADEAAQAKDAAKIYAAWKQEPVQNAEGAAAMTVTVDTGKLFVLYDKEIKAGVEEVRKDAEKEFLKEPEAGAPAMPAYVKEWVKLLPAYLEKLVDIGKTCKSVRVYVYADANALRTTTYVTAAPESDLYRIATECAGENPKYELMKYLPANSALSGGFNAGPELRKTILTVATAFCGDFIGAVDQEKAKTLVAAFAKQFQSFDGESAGALLAVSDKNAPFSALMFHNNDIAAVRAAASDISAVFNELDLMSLVSELMPELKNGEVEAKHSFKFVENAGQVEGVQYSTFESKSELKPKNAGQPEMNAAVEEMTKRLNEEMNQLQKQAFTNVEKTVIQAQGHNIEKTLAEGVKIIKEKRLGLGQDKQFLEALDACANRQIAFGYIRFLDFVKAYVGIALKSSGALPAEYTDVLMDMPDSKVPMVVAVGGKAGEKKGDEPASANFRIMSNIPAAAISEIVTAFMGVQIKMQMLHGGGMQQMPMPGPGDEGGNDGGDNGAPDAF